MKQRYIPKPGRDGTPTFVQFMGVSSLSRSTLLCKEHDYLAFIEARQALTEQGLLAYGYNYVSDHYDIFTFNTGRN